MLLSSKDDPFDIFDRWYREFCSVTTVREPSAVCLATASADAIPSVRMVLLKRYGKEGFVFFTNHNSSKGRDIISNPKASMLFYWDDLYRQVRISGTVSKLPDVDSDKYFASRDRGSCIGAWASKQSEKLQSKETMSEQIAMYEERFAGSHPPRPPHWGGFVLSPTRMEFWIGHEHRVHDRYCYCRDGVSADWSMSMLYP